MPMAAFDLVAFDLYGTLLDISELVTGMRPIVGKKSTELLARWRTAQVERSWRLNRESRYEPWDALTLAALDEVSPGLDTESRERLGNLWWTVPAYPDAGSTLATLKTAGVSRAILSNGTRAMIRAALEAAGLQVERILSADDVRVYKTDPRVYALLDGELDGPRTLFVSSNGWDVDGAIAAGRPVAWIDRGGEPPRSQPGRRIRSLSELPSLMRD
jgi:2-haloacid dehalogenase